MKEGKLIDKPYELLEEPKRGRLILIAILIFSLIFVPLYYIAASKVNNKPGSAVNKPIPVEQSQDSENMVLDGESREEESPPKIPNIGEKELEVYITDGLSKRNVDEIKKIQDYIDIKANRAATMEIIRESIKAKESFYEDLLANRSNIDPSRYIYLEDSIIKSLAMSEEFIQAFDSRTTIGDLRVIIKKYTN